MRGFRMLPARAVLAGGLHDHRFLEDEEPLPSRPQHGDRRDGKVFDTRLPYGGGWVTEDEFQKREG